MLNDHELNTNIDKESFNSEKISDYKDKIISHVAEKACKAINTKVIKDLQKMTECMQSDDDSGLKNIWDEICVQVQDEESFYWDEYVETISSVIRKQIKALDMETINAIWFQSDEGDEFCIDADYDDVDTDVIGDTDTVVNYILDKYTIPSAANWTNKRIESYIDRCNEF